MARHVVIARHLHTGHLTVHGPFGKERAEQEFHRLFAAAEAGRWSVFLKPLIGGSITVRGYRPDPAADDAPDVELVEDDGDYWRSEAGDA